MATKTAPRKKAEPKKAAPRKAPASVKVGGYTIHAGDTEIEAADGRKFGSIVCAEHGSIPILAVQDETVGKIGGRDHSKPPKAPGFDPSCENCIAAAESTVDSMHRQAQV